MPEVHGAQLLGVPQAEAWELLHDPEALAAAIPGCREFARDGGDEHRFQTAVCVSIGGTKCVYEGTVTYFDVEEPDRCGIVVAGRGERGAIEGSGQLELTSRGAATEVAYRGDFKLTGSIAGTGQRLAPAVSRRMLTETLRNLDARGRGTGAESDGAVTAEDASHAGSRELRAWVPVAAGLALSAAGGVLLTRLRR